MIEPRIKDLLYELPKTSHGQALKVYLDQQYAEINDVTSVVTLEDAKAKQIALKLLAKIFHFYGDNSVAKVSKAKYD